MMMIKITKTVLTINAAAYAADDVDDGGGGGGGGGCEVMAVTVISLYQSQ